jgi:hypothetical protein
MPKIFRFKFEENVIDEMNYFAKLHSHDSRDDFKEAWELWTKENESLITRETTRLQELGYKGDVVQKMYKSVRYYFRKKDDSLKNNIPKQRKTYVGIGNDMLEKIDNFINLYGSDEMFKPSTYLIRFIEENLYDLEKEASKMEESYNLQRNEYEAKLKKTFKNRYYLYTKRNTERNQ